MTVPLGVIDRMHLSLDGELRAMGAASSSVIVAELCGRADHARIEQRLREGSDAMVELRWQLRHGFARAPAWRAAAARHAVTVAEVAEPWVDAVASRGLCGLDGARPWRLEIWRGESRDAVVFRWFHPLIDALGAFRLMAWLGGEGDAPAAPRWCAPEAQHAARKWRERLALARAFARNAAPHGARPIASLGGNGSPGRQRLLRVRLDEQQTRRFDALLATRARRADTSIVLWAGARMLDRIFAERGVTPARYLVPVPLSLDPKQGSARMFGNNITMMMLSLDRAELEDEAAAVSRLAAQQRSIVRTEADRGMLAALDLLRRVPTPVVRWIERRPFGGKRASLLVSNPGTIALTEFAGVAVSDAYVATAVTPDPGFMLVAQRHGECMSAMLGYCDGFVSEAEVTAQVPQLLRDLLADGRSR
jgi:hypothetical protein